MIRPTPNDSRPRKASGAWYRQPVVWVGAAVFAASIGGCIWLVVVAERNADPTLPIAGMQVLKMPLTRSPPPQKPRPQP